MAPGLAWPSVVEMVMMGGKGYGKERLYNAAEGIW